MTEETIRTLKALLVNEEFLDLLVEKDIDHDREEMVAGLHITEEFLDLAYSYVPNK